MAHKLRNIKQRKTQQITRDMRSDLLTQRPLHITEPLCGTKEI